MLSAFVVDHETAISGFPVVVILDLVVLFAVERNEEFDRSFDELGKRALVVFAQLLCAILVDRQDIDLIESVAKLEL